jgi:hypothetical protein
MGIERQADVVVLSCRLPAEVTGGLWQWAKRAKEARIQKHSVEARGQVNWSLMRYL